VADASAKQILKACKVIIKFIPTIVTHSYEYNKQFATKLKLSKDIIEKMQLVCKEIENWDIFNSQLPRPRTIAVAVIYLFSRKYPTDVQLGLQDIKQAGGISTDHTIKKYFNMLLEKFDVLIERAYSREDAKKIVGKKPPVQSGTTANNTEIWGASNGNNTSI
jgi:transcription initiation factor TFIIIB Brf1 subunit/transcription initiation factor TFIIB